MRNSTQITIHTVVLLGQVLLASCASAQQVAADEPTPQYMAAERPVEVVTQEEAAQPLPYGFTIDNTKDSVVVSMDANPSTGYSWSYTVNKDSVLQQTSSNYVADNAQGMIGAGGLHHYAFSPLAAGDVTIHFVYARAWEKQNPPATITVHFTVATNGAITWETPEVYRREQ